MTLDSGLLFWGRGGTLYMHSLPRIRMRDMTTDAEKDQTQRKKTVQPNRKVN